MNEVTRMTVPPPLLTMKSQGTRESNQTVSIRTISPPSSSTSSSSTNLTTASEAVGATVFVGASAPAADSMATTCRMTRIPEVQTANGYGQHQKNNAVQQSYQQSQQRQQASHVVKIKIDPDGEKKGMVISTVRLTLDDNNPNITEHDSKIEKKNGLPDVVDDKNIGVGENNDVDKVVSATKNLVNDRRSATGVRISVYSGDRDYAINNNNNNNNNNNTCKNGENMVQQITNSETTITTATTPISNQHNNTPGNNNNNDGTKSCFYYHNFQIPLVMSSGQCSPSETLDSGTCSDLDGTPPPLPKKKNVNKRNSSTVILSGINVDDNQHNCTKSSTSSGPEVEDSDDNESNISGDSLNGIDVEDPVTSGRITVGTLQKDNGNHGSLKQSASASASASASGTGGMEAESVLETNSKIDELSRQSKVVVDIQENVSTKLGRIELTNGDGNADHHDNDVDDQERRHHIPINGTSASNSVRVSPCTSPSPSVRTTSSTGSSSYVSKASSTPRIRSPELDGKFRSSSSSSSSSSPVVIECTYEERKQEQKRLEEEISRINQLTEDEKHMAGDKYVYDRFLKFHMNGLKSDNKEDSITKDEDSGNKGEIDESFAGCKILEKEAIRSAKGTVRGVKNRVRAGIATFLQKPSAKMYREEAGKLVVYTTSLGVVRETYYRCIKVKQILRTNMARFDEKDLLYRSELKTELKDRIGDASMHLPQIFVDGQYLGDGERIEELNESGQLRDILQPYITDYRQLGQCTKCGDYRMLLCTTCNGSKRSHYRNEFTKEIVALRCMKCNEAGLIVCDSC